MRPIKLRFYKGIQLADNLFTDPKGRKGFYRYKRANGSMKTFQMPTVEQANELAVEANKSRHAEPAIKQMPLRHQISFHVPIYIHYMERINPKLKTRTEWKNHQYSFYKFAREFETCARVSHETISVWWEDLTFHQQKRRQASFRRWFNWMMGKKLFPKLEFNPFTLSDDVPRLLVKMEPDKNRPPCTQIGFRKIYKKAPEMGYEALYNLTRGGYLQPSIQKAHC